jgi:hypothetical protein
MDNNRYTSDETRFENSSSYDSVSTRSSHFNRNGDLKTYIKAAILIFAFASIFCFVSELSSLNELLCKGTV